MYLLHFLSFYWLISTCIWLLDKQTQYQRVSEQKESLAQTVYLLALKKLDIVSCALNGGTCWYCLCCICLFLCTSDHSNVYRWTPQRWFSDCRGICWILWLLQELAGYQKHQAKCAAPRGIGGWRLQSLSGVCQQWGNWCFEHTNLVSVFVQIRLLIWRIFTLGGDFVLFWMWKEKSTIMYSSGKWSLW